MKIKNLILSTVAILAISGCESTSETTKTKNTTPAQSTSITGKAIDGYLKGATVCLDLDANTQCSSDEPSDTTDANGNFTLEITDAHTANANYKSSDIIAYGGIDIDTNLAFTGELSTPFYGQSGQINVTPVTTMVAQYNKKLSKRDLKKAKRAVAKLLNVDESELGRDPVADAQNGKLKILEAALALQKAVDFIVATEIAGGSKDSKRKLSRNIYREFVQHLDSSSDINALILNSDISSEVANAAVNIADIVIKEINARKSNGKLSARDMKDIAKAIGQASKGFEGEITFKDPVKPKPVKPTPVKPTPVKPTPVKPTPTVTPIQKIANYAKDGGTPPTLSDYRRAGVSGVTASNLNTLNATIVSLNYADVDTLREINAIVVSITPSAPSIPAFSIPAISASQKAEFLNAVNQARATSQDCGVYGIKPAVPALTWSDALYKAAYTYNYDMVHGNAWSHRGSGTASDIASPNGTGSTMTNRINHYGYQYSTIGENIAKGQSSTAAVIAGWIDSDSHCKNLMNPNFSQAGMSLINTNTSYRYFWTQNFGAPRGYVAPTPPAPTPATPPAPQGTVDYTIFVYGSDTCPRTTRMRNTLTAQNIPFTYVTTAGATYGHPMWVKARAEGWTGSVALPVVDVNVGGTVNLFQNPSLESDMKPLIGL